MARSHIDYTGRVCLKCGVYKPWSEYYVNRKGAYGKTTTCAECKREEHRIKHGGRSTYQPGIVINAEGRTCTECLEFYPWAEYHKARAGANGYKSKCNECSKKWQNKRKGK